MFELTPIIKAYIRQFDEFFERESYKWKALKHFQDTYFSSKLPLAEKLSLSLKFADNLLNSKTYFPARMLDFFAKDKSERLRIALNLLFDESEPFVPRVASFIEETEHIFQTMKNEGYRDWKDRDNVQSFQDTHAVSVYLTLHSPANNYIYKWTVFKTAAEKLGYKIESKNKVEKISEFYSFCDTIKVELLKERDFILKYDKILNALEFIDPNYNLLTQDFIYAVARYLNADAFKKKDKKKPLARSIKILNSNEFFTVESEIEKEFKGKKGIDYAKQDEKKRNLGREGEIWAYNHEKERLLEKGIKFEVRDAALLDGDGLGYDILSVEDDGVTPRYIEVKTTTGGAYQPFYFSANELNRSVQDSSHFYLYRVCNFRTSINQADIIVIHGSLKDLNATPVTYKAELKK